MWPFDQNNQQMYQNYANAWDQGTYHQLPPQETAQNYQQFVQNAPPQVVQQAHEQYFQQMPPQQRGNMLQGLLSGLMQNGFNPQQAGIQNTDPYSMSPQEGARLMGYAQQQPGLLQQLTGSSGGSGNPLVRMAVSGIVSYAAKQMMGNNSNTGGGFRL